MATEISKINNKIWDINKIKIKNKLFKDWPDEPSNDSNKCPAIIFAVRRILSVIGRISNLIDSINTIKGINNVGVPDGVKWANIIFVWLIQLKSIIPIHIGRESDIQNLIWLEAVKM